MGTKILIIGACGQIGSELTLKLRNIYGNENVIASDIREGNEAIMSSGPFEIINAMEFDAVANAIEKHQIDEVYLMATMSGV